MNYPSLIGTQKEVAGTKMQKRRFLVLDRMLSSYWMFAGAPKKSFVMCLLRQSNNTAHLIDPDGETAKLSEEEEFFWWEDNQLGKVKEHYGDSGKRNIPEKRRKFLSIVSEK